MEKTTEQRAADSFLLETSFNATKTFEMIQKVYSGSAVHHATVFRWYHTFSERQESIRNEQRSGTPTMARIHSNVARIADILKEDRPSSCRLIAE